MERSLANVLTMILAGGKGTRLEPLTRDRAKPAVPFGAQYRIIDFVLSNCINSGLRRIQVLTQYKAASLDRHINRTWQGWCRDSSEFIDIISPQQRINEQWYLGTADAIYQNIYSIEMERPDEILILGGDHIYKMNYARMIEFHRAHHADLTVACLPVPLAETRRFGVLEVDDQQRVVGFAEKPSRPTSMPDDPACALASMGIYVFSMGVLFDRLYQDAADSHSQRDFGRDVIPRMIGECRVFAFPFRDENKKSAAYWRDVGTLAEYYQANMELIQVDPVLNLYDTAWPIRTMLHQDPPPKFVFGEDYRGSGVEIRRGEAVDSIVCAGTVISGGQVCRSLVARQVRVNSYARIEDSIIFEGVRIGRHCRIRRAIIDKNVDIPAGTEIGFDLDLDRARGFLVSEEGIVVIPKSEGPETFLRDH